MNIRIVSIFIAISFIACSAPKSKQEEKGKSFSEYGPADYLWEKWAYPNDSFDEAYFDKVFNGVKENLALKSDLADVSWRMEGPYNIGGRINVVVLNPDDETEIWLGTSAGGIFRSSNSGDDWETIGDSFSILSIGSIAFDPQNTDVVYVGTGDPNISGYPKSGEGIYKTEDGGSTWTHLGPAEVGVVSKIIVDPTDSETVYMASMGIPYYETPDRGIYKSTDGGENWENVLFLSESAGISALVNHPTMPDTMYAAGWDRIRSNTVSIVSGNHSRIYRTYDGGTTWDTLTNGLPEEVMSRAGVDISISDPSVLYASFVDANDMNFYGIYKSEDYGDSWIETSIGNLDGALGGFGWYFGMVRINPLDNDEVSVAGVELHSTANGGVSWNQSTPDWWMYVVHADMHDLTYASNGDVYLATDGGLYRSSGGIDINGWEDADMIPNTQLYRVAVNPHEVEIYAAGAQDNGTMDGNYEDVENWNRLRGGDGFTPIYNPDNANIMYSTVQNGSFAKSTDGGNNWDGFTSGIGDEHVAWDAPIIISTHNSDVLYTGTTRVYKNTNGNWNSISEELNASEEFYPANRHVITMVAESPLDEDVLYAGTSDGKMWVTTDGGAAWEDITTGLPDRYVTDIKASTVVNGRVFITHSGYKDGDDVAHIHRSDDYGQTWIGIGGDLPDFGLNHVEVLNNNNDSVLFVASDGGVYYSLNSGMEWMRAGDNMPIILVFDIEIDYDANRLVAGTFARSVQSLSLDSLFNVGTTSVKEYQKVTFSLFPNPASEQIRITSTENIQGSKWEITDVNGKIIKQGLINGEAISIAPFPSGVYFIRLEGANGSEVKKWIKR